MSETWQIVFAACSAVALLLTAYTGWRRRSDQLKIEEARGRSELASSTTDQLLAFQTSLISRVERLEEQNGKLVGNLLRSRLAMRRERERCDRRMEQQRKELLALLARYRRGNGCELRKDDPIRGDTRA